MEEKQASKGTKNSSFIWGVLLIVFGVFSLVSNNIELEAATWSLALAGAGVLALGFYVFDRSRLFYLVPSYILFGVAALIHTVTNNILEDEFIAIFILSVIAIPFVVGYISAPSKNWGMLIPAYVLFAVSGILLISAGTSVSDDLIAPYVLTAIALPFLIGYLRDPAKNVGFLLPAYILLAVGIMVLLILREVLDDLLIPSYVMFAVALPFAWGYSRNREKKGLLIPAGILALIGTSFLLFSASVVQYVVPVLLILAGLGLIIQPAAGGRSETAA